MPPRIDPARCHAILIGIDGYAERPLTSAVNDVAHVHAALRALDLCAEANIVRLTSPAQAGQPEATRRNISAALYRFYDDDKAGEIDRLFFFFAGHGLLAFAGAARGAARTALMPVDVQSLDLDGNLLLDLDEIRERLQFRGPKEQLYFIDACRDLPYKRQPDVGPLGWSERPRLGAERAQSVLWAVPPLGQARADRSGLGAMTKRLVEALHAQGEALDWDDELETHVVTMRSVHAYVTRTVREAISDEPLWKQKYSEPRLEEAEPGPAPLRVLEAEAVPDAELAVHITPEEAADMVEVRAYLKGQLLEGLRWPPRKNHEKVALRPLRYSLRVSAQRGRPSAERLGVDVRVQHEAKVTVELPSPPPRPSPPALGGMMSLPSPGPPLVGGMRGGPPLTCSRCGAANVDSGQFCVVCASPLAEPPVFRGVPDFAPPSFGPPPVALEAAPAQTMPTTPWARPRTRRSAKGHGRITTRALEPETTIEIDGLDTPHARFSDRATIDQEVPMGTYRVAFRLGGDVFYKTEVDVDDDEIETVTPQVLASPLAREVFVSERGGRSSVVLSDVMGPIQAGVVPTLLAMLGVKLFTVRHRLGDFDRHVLPHDPAALKGRPVALVVAADGDGWAKPVPDVLNTLRFRLTSWGMAPGPWTPFAPLCAVPDLRSGRGLARVHTAVAEVPPGPFLVELWSGMMPLLRLPSVAIAGRAAVITLAMQPDGGIDVFQHVPPLPDEVDKRSSPMPYATMLRRLVVGQLLHRRGELSAMGLRQGFRHDPILSAMDLFTGFAAGEHFTSLRESAAMVDNLLPDNLVIQALIAPERDALLARCLDAGFVPLLAESTRVLAGEAPRLGRPRAPVVEWARRIPEGSLWTLNLE